MEWIDPFVTFPMNDYPEGSLRDLNFDIYIVLDFKSPK
jgi:hypothetical protein